MDVVRSGSREFSEATARAVLEAASASVGLDDSDARCLRLGENAVFSLTGDVVARVVRATGDSDDVARTVQVARWLQHEGVPAVEALDVDQPVAADDMFVTFWRSLGDGDNYGTTADLARLLRLLHGRLAPADLGLPQLDPFARAERRLRAVEIPDDDRDFLAGRLATLRQAFGELRFELPPGVIHDDASVGNVLVDQVGTPRLIDLDGVCNGPREWDLILTAIYYDRYGWHTKAEYETFCEIYGFDIMTWPGYETLANLRELIMVTWMAQNIGQDDRTAREFVKRLQALRLGSSRRDWQPL